MLKSQIDVSVEEPEPRRKSRNRKPKPPAPTEPLVSGAGTEEEKSEAAAPTQPPVLMVEVENIVHEKFRQTEEVKVGLYFSLTLYPKIVNISSYSSKIVCLSHSTRWLESNGAKPSSW